METQVFQNDDLRKYILSYLRKEAKIKCTECNNVCVWDVKVKPYIILNSTKKICIDCWCDNYNNSECKIS